MKLAKRRKIQFNGEEIARTPLLLPSFSSKGFELENVNKIIKVSGEIITGPILISAYDIFYKYIKNKINFPSLIFVDSGGYESLKDFELSSLNYPLNDKYKPNKWTQPMYKEVLKGWSSEMPTVFVSFDSSEVRGSIDKQIRRAKKMFGSRNNIIKEIILKTEKKGDKGININSVIKNIRTLSEFDIIGLTEKELGDSFLGRMKNVAKLRIALDKVGVDTPLHIFGSLDPISTPLYFISGADIFDGLTWLRFGYVNGVATYKHNHIALRNSLNVKDRIINPTIIVENYHFLEDLTDEMRRFLKRYNFKSFTYHKELFRNAYDSLIEELGEEFQNGR